MTFNDEKSTDEDPIVAEVRASRHRIAMFYGNDLRLIAEAAARGFDDFKCADAQEESAGGAFVQQSEQMAFA